MIRRGYVRIRWASRLESLPESQRRTCKWCQLRSFHPSSSRLEEEKESTTKSALDGLFDAPDAYDRHMGAPTHNKDRSFVFQNQKIPRTVLGDDLSKEFASQLNQEWEGSPKRRNEHQSSKDRAPLRGPHAGESRKQYKGTMTPSESKIFNEIFTSFFQQEAGRSNNVKPREDDGALGGSFSSNNLDALEDFQQRNRLARKDREAKKRFLSSVLSERASDVSEDEIELGIDEAREEIVACNNVSELWQWASKNVWGLKVYEQQQGFSDTKGRSGLEDESDESQSVSTDEKIPSILEATEMEVKEVRFGMATPYYAPVLLLLLTNLRERFNSPQSALAVLRVAKNLGADSFVLGCSPQLYAEALRTQWMMLRDLQGTKDTFKEAKDTGIIGRATPIQTVSDLNNSKVNEEARFMEIASKVKSDVRFQVKEGVKRLPDGVIPSVYEHQMELVEGIDKILNSSRRPVSRAMSQTARGPDNRYARR